MTKARPRAHLAGFLALSFMAAAPQQQTVPRPHHGALIPSQQETEFADQVRALLNTARDESGLAVLIESSQLNLLAYQHSREMARRGQVAHHSYDFGVSTKTRVQLAFPGLLRFAENVARNQNPKLVHAALMRSRGHRLNRMDPAFTYVGIGVARASAYQIYVTELFARPSDPEVLANINVLYTEADPATLPHDDAMHGEITSETVTVPPPSKDDPEYWTHRGIEAFNDGAYGRAVENFRRALGLDPGYEYARFDLGRALLALGDGNAAVEVLERHLQDVPDDLDAWESLGSAALLASSLSLAEDAFRRVLATRPRSAITWYNLGLTLEYRDRPTEAENAYAQALHLDSSLVAAVAGLARVRR